jgi:Phage integrase, N-terminal SAM-like domain
MHNRPLTSALLFWGCVDRSFWVVLTAALRPSSFAHFILDNTTFYQYYNRRMTANPADQLPTAIAPADRLLTAAEFHRLADVPPEVEWFANLGNAHTRAYENAVKDFMRFAGVRRPEEFRTVTRAHLIAWRDQLRRRDLGGATIRHRLAALASLFEYLCEKNAVTHNPVKGVERPKTESGEGKTPAIGDHQAHLESSQLGPMTARKTSHVAT